MKAIDVINAIKYVQGDYRFYFSSKVNLEQYKKNITNYIITEQKFLQDRYLVDYVDFDRLLYLTMYHKCEDKLNRVEVIDIVSKKYMYTIPSSLGVTVKFLIKKGKHK